MRPTEACVNPLPRLRKRLSDEQAVWGALRSEPAPHVAAVQAALSVEPPDVEALRAAGLAAVTAAFAHWAVPPPADLADGARRFAMLPGAGDALVGAAIAELAQVGDVGLAAEGLELVLDWTWSVLRADPRDLSDLAAPAPESDDETSRRTRRALLAGLGFGLLVSAVLLADPFDWFGRGKDKKRQKGHRKGKGKAGKSAKGDAAQGAAVQDSPSATRDGQKKNKLK